MALTLPAPPAGDTDWRALAACRNTDPALFFPIGTTGPAVEQINSAKEVCQQCPAREPCLAFAMNTRQDSGVWGGMTEGRASPAAPAEPRRLRRGRAAPGPTSAR